jgi:putative intracellular protease/amidase
VNLRTKDGQCLVAGKRVAAFSNAEEEAAGLTKVMPILLESTLIQRGATYSKAGLWEKHVVVDGRLVTGQNPASAARLGEAVAKLLSK